MSPPTRPTVTANPFRPSFGVTPPLLAGRETTAALFGDALDGGPGAPGRATLYTGGRGVGKTVMLNRAEDQAKERGWVAVSETATTGLLDRLANDALPGVARTLGLVDEAGRITGISLPGGFAIDREPGRQSLPTGVRQWIAFLTDHLAQNETGLLITIDEVHAGDRGDLRQFGAVLQHAFREERPVAFAAAGLPRAVDDLLSDDVLTFLRRAERHHLGPVSMPDARDAIAFPIRDRGRDISDEAVRAAAQPTGGYPYLIQLVGFHLWKATNDSVIQYEHVEGAVAAAQERLGDLVYDAAMRDLSPTDRAFLYAMVDDNGRPSRHSDLAERLGKSTSNVSQYRLRLLGTDLIVDAGRGYVAYALPRFREYLLETEDRWRD